MTKPGLKMLLLKNIKDKLKKKYIVKLLKNISSIIEKNNIKILDIAWVTKEDETQGANYYVAVEAFHVGSFGGLFTLQLFKNE